MKLDAPRLAKKFRSFEVSIRKTFSSSRCILEDLVLDRENVEKNVCKVYERIRCARSLSLGSEAGAAAGPRTQPSIEKVDPFNRPLPPFFIH